MIRMAINALTRYAPAIDVCAFLNRNLVLRPAKKEKRMTKTMHISLLSTLLFCSTALVGAQTVHITEIRIDHIGADINEYFELAGTPGESLNGLTYLVIGDGAGGNDGVIEFFIDLSEHSINDSGRFVVAEDQFDIAGAPAPDLLLDSKTNELNFENSDNVTHMLVTGFTGELLQDLDLDDNGTLDIEPWAGVLDLIAIIEEENPPINTEYHYGPPTVGPDGPFVPGHVYLCEPSGIWLIGTFDPVGTDIETPGEPNPDCECGDDGTGNCFDLEGTGTPFCEDGECCQDICDNHDETCCTDEWDDVCAGLAADFCLKGGKPPVVTLSEIRTGQGGSDTDEYFELTADFDTILDGVSYIVIGDGIGGSGVIEHVTDLGGNQFFSNFFVAAKESFSLGIADIEVPLNFEDSDNVTHMLVWNFTGELFQDLDTNDDGTLDIQPWQLIIDSVAIIGDNERCVDEFCVYSDNVVGPDGIFTPGHVYKCDPTQAWTVGEFFVEDACAVDPPQAVNQNCELVCPCGSENAGSCFEVNGNANCDDAECCDLITGGEPSCADDWDQSCVDLALEQCLTCGDQAAGNCLEANGTPFCNFQPCCDAVCELDPTCCELPDGWDQGCADLADANCNIPEVEQGDLVFALSVSDPAESLELVRGPAEMNGGVAILDFWDEPFMQSVEFDNLDCISHNDKGNLLALNFGTTPPGGTGGTIHSLTTCSPTSTDQFLGDTLGDGGAGLTPTRLGGLSVSPDNTKIAVGGYDSQEVIVYDYIAGNCEGEGGSLSGARETAGDPLWFTDTQGTTWLNNNTVLAFATGGDIIAVNADTMASKVVATVKTIKGCGPGFTDIEYNPQVSPNVYAMYSAFTGSTRNLLFILDPTDNFTLLRTLDYSSSINTTREIAFDADGNLYLSQFGGTIDIILDAANFASLEDNDSLDWYASPTAASFSGLDVAIGQTGPPPACSPCSGDCCDSDGNGTPGCDDDECCNLVCDTAGFESCCDVEWTAACAAEAQEVCSDSVCCGVCPTDVDGDGLTGAFDLAVLLGNWGPTVPDSACLDANADGIIGAFDLAFLLGNWGPC